MASKTVTISPAGAAAAAQAAGVSATCVDYDYQDYGSSGWMRWYRLTAPTIAGWTFSHFEWEAQTNSSDPIAHSETQNPFPPTGEGRDYPNAYTLAEQETRVLSTTYLTVLQNLVAVYRERTHLLVNSSNVETPVKLVYDPTTNLLVADY